MTAGGETFGAGRGARIQPLEEGDPTDLGTYTLLGRLAAGGMGRIYLARSRGDGSLAAVKTLLAEGYIGDVDRRRFAREVKIARRAEGVRTARVLDADPEAERPWMATEYVPAPSVSELVRRAGPLTGTAARWVTRGALEALVELHRQDIVHRDVKPQNLLLELSGPRLIDFGISHAADLTRTQLTLGTLAFTSPEQARGEPSTAASDVYSLGATLFHLAVGRSPYPPDTEMLLLLTYVAEADTDLAGLPDELGPVVRACLALSPEDRPSAEELLERFAFELAEMPTAPDAGGWLPTPWTRLIEGYARQGRALTADPRAEAPEDEERTRVLREKTQDGTAATQVLREAPETETAHGDPARTEAEGPSRTGVAAEAEAPSRTNAATPTPADHPGISGGARVLVRSVQAVMASLLLLLAGGAAYGYYWYSQADNSDATDRAFDAVATGDCVTTDLDFEHGWTDEAPRTADCRTATNAPWRVIAREKGGLVERCMGGDGAMAWTRQSGAGMVSLCLERRFTNGECVLGPEPTDNAVLQVMPIIGDTVFATTVDCSGTPPRGRAVLRVVTSAQVERGCPEEAVVQYRFTERGRLLCLALV
ncbi:MULTISPECIES: serine/threonine-protein kinase [unclassified Streptomyces]|uniref:serine/threonine protein kinase n=1 Tax=unclassified Streptomyces TaxID=2593676 RepID=UPI002F9087FD